MRSESRQAPKSLFHQSSCWYWLRAEALRRLDEGRVALTEAGFTLDWKDRRVSGFPFRLDAEFTDVRLGEPSGWRLSAPSLKAEAYAYGLGCWVFVVL